MSKKNIYFKFEMLVLCILYEKDCYGYEISNAIKKKSDGIIDIKEGSLYPSLYRLLDTGYISSRDEIINRKLRVYYHIEEKGIAYLEEMIKEYYTWDKKIKAIINSRKK